MSCARKHLSIEEEAFWLKDETWHCPKCGSGADAVDKANVPIMGFILESDSLDCDAVHYDDIINCYVCEYTTTVKKFIKLLQAKANMVKCPCCKGLGMVRK
jgi:hypothetical protein